MEKEKYILTIKAEDRPGLLHLVTGMINRRLIEIESVSAAKTGLPSVVMITIELLVSKKALQALVPKLENVIEVYAVRAIKASEAYTRRCAFFKLSRAFLETPKAQLLHRYNARIVNLYPQAILVSKSGCDTDIRQLYEQLDGPYLLAYEQSGLITDSQLGDEDESSVISRAA